MNASFCRYEQEVMTALRLGLLSHEIQAHVSGCAECSEAMFVAHSLQRDADSVDEISLPDSHVIWRRALRRSRAEAAARAARPIEWVTYASMVVMITAVFWLIVGSPSWFHLLAAPLYTSNLHAVSGMSLTVSLVAGAITILTALFGAVYILRLDLLPVAPIR
jgi:hypothetical protein